MKRASYPLSLILLGGLVSLYIGERIIATGVPRAVFSIAGVLAVVLAVVLRGLRAGAAGKEHPARRSIERSLLALYGAVLLSVVLYLVSSDAPRAIGWSLLENTAPKLNVVLSALWPALLVSSLLSLLLVELSYEGMVWAPTLESGRVREALFSGLGLGFVLIFAFSVYYVVSELNTKWDLAYFRTARAGEATKNLVRSLNEDVTVTLFYPPANETAEALRDYFSELGRESPHLKVESLDQAVDLARAKALGISSNGAIVFSKGQRKESLFINVEFERARNQLRNLDKDVNKRLTTIARDRRTVYLVVGHGERGVEAASNPNERWPVRLVRDQLVSQNYEVKNLGPAEGLASEVPGNAAAIFILGPTQDFLPEELRSIERYYRNGGRIFVALDPETGGRLEPLLTAFGVKYNPVMLANDQAYIRRSQQASDRAFILTASYTSHPSVTSLSRAGARVPMAFVQSGSLEHINPLPAETRVDATVNSHPSTWNDLNGNFEPETPPEVRRVYELAAAVTLKRGDKEDSSARAIVLADSDALTDPVLQVQGNALFFLDSTKWLLGDEELVGEITTEADVPIQHTREKDVAWFYTTTFLAPALVLGAGFIVTRRRGKRKGAAAREEVQS